MSDNKSDYDKLLRKYSEIQNKNYKLNINSEKKKEVNDLIESGLIFKELGMTVDDTSLKNKASVPTKKPDPAKSLSIHNPASLTINPDEFVKYSKETQTATETCSNVNSEADSPRLGGVASPKFLTGLQWDDEFDLPFDEHLEDEGEFSMAFLNGPPNGHNKRKVTEYSENEKEEILSSDHFLEFFNDASYVIEEHLQNNKDIFTDYSGIYEDDKSLLNSKKIIDFNRSLFDERWSWNRVVTGLNWSPHYSEQLLAGYFSNETVSHEPDGVCLIWNIKSKMDAPENVLLYQSPIIASQFAKYHSSLVVGGTYSGQIVIWDIRSNKRTPVQRTLLSATAHTHPVTSLSTIGTSNAHSLLSLSTDGKMCSWRMEMLSQPLESFQLSNSKSKEVTSTCMEFLQNDSKFIVGGEDGNVYLASRIGSKPGECVAVEGAGHHGPIMSISTQRCSSDELTCRDLFLTSSVDYSVKLWSSSKKHSSDLIFTLDDRSDYVYDVDWSPIHPSVFCCVDGSGRLEIWNFLRSVEEPIAKVTMDAQSALNRCKWHDSGLSLATGDDMGRVRLHDINEHSVQNRNVSWTELDELIDQLHFDSDNSVCAKDLN